MNKPLFSNKLLKGHYSPVINGYYDRADMKKTTQGEDWHAHNVYEIMYVSNKKAHIDVEEGTVAVHNHQLMFLNSQAWHRLSLKGETFSMLNIEFAFEPCNEEEFSFKNLYENNKAMKKFVRREKPYLLINDPDERILAFLKQAVALADSRHEQSEALITTLINMLLLLMARVYEKEQEERKPQVYEKNLKKVIEDIHQNFSGELTVKKIAKNHHIHPTYLALLFNEYLGITPREYINKVRLEEGKKLLEITEETILEISTAVGFNNQQYFSKKFKERYGVAPRMYRKEYQKTKEQRV